MAIKPRIYEPNEVRLEAALARDPSVCPNGILDEDVTEVVYLTRFATTTHFRSEQFDEKAIREHIERDRCRTCQRRCQEVLDQFDGSKNMQRPKIIRGWRATTVIARVNHIVHHRLETISGLEKVNHMPVELIYTGTPKRRPKAWTLTVKIGQVEYDNKLLSHHERPEECDDQPDNDIHVSVSSADRLFAIELLSPQREQERRARRAERAERSRQGPLSGLFSKEDLARLKKGSFCIIRLERREAGTTSPISFMKLRCGLDEDGRLTTYPTLVPGVNGRDPCRYEYRLTVSKVQGEEIGT